MPNHQIPGEQCTKEAGPVPEGEYKVFISDHGMAKDDGRGICALKPSWGIQEIPRGTKAGVCERYIVLNPIRAGMIKTVVEWEWSSYHAMINPKIAPEWLETDWLLACFSKQKKRAINKYIDFVRAGMGLPSIWENLKYQAYLGSDDFVEGMCNKLDVNDKEALKEVTRIERRPMAKPLKWYQQNAESPKKAMALAYLSGDYSMKEIAGWFSVHYSTVSRALKSYETNT